MEQQVTAPAASRREHKQVFRGRHLASQLVTGAESEKHTCHHEIGLELASVDYLPGDALGIHAHNDPALIERIVRAIGASGDEPVGAADEPPTTLLDALATRYSVAAPSRRLLELLAGRGAGDLAPLLEPANTAQLKQYLSGPDSHDVLDVLESHPGIEISPAELVDTLRSLLPRLYSIASSQRAHPDQVHALVISVRFTIRGRERLGLSSTWINDRWPIGATAEMYLQNQQVHFAMPADPSTPMIMVGPGTGIAPFRAFLEERRAAGATGPNWLFFGEQHRASGFYYGTELAAYERDGFLRLDTAFSRDQDHKIYVQHRMRENARDIWAWLEAGAEFFVCGDKARMAADVDRELHAIVETAGGRTPDQAKEYVSALKKSRRYKRDVY
ncbi:MAG: FAD-binding protein [Vicinamibacterales bacterium]